MRVTECSAVADCRVAAAGKLECAHVSSTVFSRPARFAPEVVAGWAGRVRSGFREQRIGRGEGALDDGRDGSNEHGAARERDRDHDQGTRHGAVRFDARRTRGSTPPAPRERKCEPRQRDRCQHEFFGARCQSNLALARDGSRWRTRKPPEPSRLDRKGPARLERGGRETRKEPGRFAGTRSESHSLDAPGSLALSGVVEAFETSRWGPQRRPPFGWIEEGATRGEDERRGADRAVVGPDRGCVASVRGRCVGASRRVPVVPRAECLRSDGRRCSDEVRRSRALGMGLDSEGKRTDARADHDRETSEEPCSAGHGGSQRIPVGR